jgi:hypothetical protein
MVSAVLPIGELHINLNASKMTCKMPKPMQNWKIALYSTACAAGLIGAGKYNPVVGIWAKVKLLKNAIARSRRF